MKLKTIIVDDEPYAIEVIENYLTNFHEIKVVAKCSNAIEAFQTLQKERVDLLFLDVQMPGMTGTDLMRSLKTPPKVIFTTAFPDYAVSGFDLNAVDYLLKPVPFDRFLKALDKVFNLFKMQQPTIQYSNPLNTERSADNYLLLRVDRKMTKINIADIYWIESIKDYIKVILKDKTLISKQKIGLLEDLLPDESFIRIHRSFIIALDKVESYHGYCVEIGGKELPIGRSYKSDCYKRLSQ
ncbi:LytR/AlgR family response regulator transcription factor [Olivibacter sitiensis]|uniref:LytR/AlgR family response regulator transcription factor n=1 Tax=Olivibacter sitiensis TaxID=376470 RepID=UPI000407C952|nr:LytTR family DNA-binding domain-containing protein [Olivibacter sitiensis]